MITVEIFKETYDIMKTMATKKRWNTKDFINMIIAEAIKRDKFLHAYAPFLCRIGFENDILVVRDTKLNTTAEIYLRDRTLYCNVCESKDCIHIYYALILPEIAKLYLQAFWQDYKVNWTYNEYATATIF